MPDEFAPRERHGDHPLAFPATQALPAFPAFLALLTLLLVLAPRPALAAGCDFVNETLVARGLGGREMGVELVSESRLDRWYRLQGWFTPEFEVGVTRSWVLEGTASFINRGRGLEFGGWRGESRYVLLEEPRWPVALAVAAEYEVEAKAAKLLTQERVLVGRGMVTRTFAGSVLATFNWGWNHLLGPLHRTDSVQCAGVRFPENAPITYGFEYRRERLERLTQYGPSVRIRLPNKMQLRLGGFAGEGSRLYRFVGRAILEVDL
jgi:hypothetical protein